MGTAFGASLGALPALEEFVGNNNAGRFWTDAQFAEFLAGAKKLRVLRIGHIRDLTWNSLQNLFTMPKCLRELDLSSMTRMDPQWPKLLIQDDSTLKASATNEGLTSLSIPQVPMNRHGLFDLVQAFPNLEVLDISQVRCTEQALLELCKLRKLRSLQMSVHEFQSPDTLYRMVRLMPNLTYLRVTNQTNATGDVVKHPCGVPRLNQFLILEAAANKNLIIDF